MILLQDHGDKNILDIKQIPDQLKLIQWHGEQQFLANKLLNSSQNMEHQQKKSILELLSMEEDLKLTLEQAHNLMHQQQED